MIKTPRPVLPDPAVKSRYVAAMFARIARRYDLMNALMTAGQDRRWRSQAIQLVRPPDDESLGSRLPGKPNRSRTRLGLDVAAGTGDLALTMAREAGLDGVIAIDFCPEMLYIAATKNNGPTPIGLAVADGLQLPFPDDTFVCATVGFGVRNFVDLPRAFAEMRRVLQPGGRVACLELTRSPNGLFNRIFDIYFDHLVPMIGQLVAGDAEAYTYLPSSVKRFPPADELADIMRSAGLREVHYHRRGLGTVAIHVGTK